MKPRNPVRAALPLHLRNAIDKYNRWDDSQDPSKLGALNLAAYIGEVVSAIARRGQRMNSRRRA